MMTTRKLMLVGSLLMLGAAQARGDHGRVDAVLEWNRIAFEEVLNQQPPPEQVRFAATGPLTPIVLPSPIATATR